MSRNPVIPAHRSSIDGFEELFSSRLLVVTGKGGVGKTTVAASLAIAAANAGRRTLLVEVEGRQGFSRAFRTQPWDYEEREFRPGLYGLAIDPEESMYEYLDMYYGLRRMSWVMSRTNALDFVTAAAPGLRDLLLVGKLYEIERRRREDGRPAYDVIVLDAPPTGRIGRFLRAPEGVSEIVRVGPIKRQSAHVTEMIEDPSRTRVLVVTLLEELPVTETVEAVEELRELGVRVGAIVANNVLVSRGDEEVERAATELDVDELLSAASGVGLDLQPTTAELALRQVSAHQDRLDLQRGMRARLDAELDAPRLELPLLTGATFDETDLEVLADVIAVNVGEAGPKAVRR